MVKPATIKDIAKTLNVAASTVSRALRGQSGVSEATRKLILEVAAQLDYQPNKVALSLLSKHTSTIGVIVPNLDYLLSTAVRGIDEVALNNGYALMVCPSNESFERECKNVNRLQESRVDGYIISATTHSYENNHLKRLIEKGIPVVFFDRDYSELVASKVLLDNEHGGFLATEHLIQQGCSSIAFIGGSKEMVVSKKRMEGYVKALQQYHIPFDEELVFHGEFTREHGYLTTLEILKKKKKKVDGIFAISDRIAIGVMLAIKDKGLSMPQDMALVGFNNDPVADLVSPGLSSVDQPAYKMGKVAAELFFEMLKEGEHFSPKEVVIKPKLIVRESSRRKE